MEPVTDGIPRLSDVDVLHADADMDAGGYRQTHLGSGRCVPDRRRNRGLIVPKTPFCGGPTEAILVVRWSQVRTQRRPGQCPRMPAQVTLPSSPGLRVYDVAILCNLLARVGIVPLVWGEMASLAVYGSALVANRLFFVIPDRLVPEALRCLTQNGLNELSTFTDSELAMLPLSAPYHRFALSPAFPGDPSEPYLQIFSASDVGLHDMSAWDTGIWANVSHEHKYAFLVPNLRYHTLIGLHLYRSVLLNTDKYSASTVTGALFVIEGILRDPYDEYEGCPVVDIPVPEEYAEICRTLFVGLHLSSMLAISDRDALGLKYRLRSNVAPKRQRWVNLVDWQYDR